VDDGGFWPPGRVLGTGYDSISRYSIGGRAA